MEPPCPAVVSDHSAAMPEATAVPRSRAAAMASAARMSAAVSPGESSTISAPVMPSGKYLLIVLNFDKLGRLATEFVALIDRLGGWGIAFKALNSPMDTTTPDGRAFLQIRAAFAVMERNIIR